MPTIIDACSIINLFNAGALHDGLCLAREKFYVTPLVVLECGPACAAELARLRGMGCIDFLGDPLIPADRFLELVAEHDIGDGELECIVACESSGYSFCTDDGPARKLGSRLLGAHRILGGLRVLKWTVEDGVSNCHEAHMRYLAMRDHGGFLPTMEKDWFCNAAEHQAPNF